MSESPTADAAALRERMTRDGIRTVRVTFIDNSGVARARNVSQSMFLRAGLEEGIQYPSAMLSVDTGANFVVPAGAGFASGYPSWVLKPDLSTFVVLPWVPGTAKVVADLYTLDGTKVESAPRAVLQRVIDALRQEGYVAHGAVEHEFYVFRSLAHGQAPQPSWTGSNCYAEVKQQQVDDILTTLGTNLEAIGLGIEEANTEYGPGQFEISSGHFEGVRAADMSAYYKMAVKELMHQLGYVATFMTKPVAGISGSGAHFHHSLYDTAGHNAFHDPDGEYGLSDVARWFIGGELRHAAAVCALANPSVNSYKRLRPYTFAPSNVSWGLENRMTLLRVPHARGSATRLENRLPGADNNPYLMMAAVYAAGLDGIRNHIEPETFIQSEDAYARTDLPGLPNSLADALAALQHDEALVELLGKAFITSYALLKGNEIARFNDAVTDWEVNEYLELF